MSTVAQAESRAAVQFDLFEDVLHAFEGGRPLSTKALYKIIASKKNIDEARFEELTPVGKSGEEHNLLRRSVRWAQQTLKGMGLLRRTDERGVWEITPAGKGRLTPAEPDTARVAFSTWLGIAIWADAATVFPRLDESIKAVICSPPYPLRVPRAYGGPSEQEYVDWLCRLLEPLVKNLDRAGSVALNVSPDIFMPGSPARSLYPERLALALHSRLGLQKIDHAVWLNPSRPPGPIRWASITRQQLNASYEHIFIYAKDAERFGGDNRRVLEPHSETHKELMARGGERRETSHGDGSHRVRVGSYGRETAGRIPRNVLTIPHNCSDKSQLAKLAKEAGLPVHGATMPLKLATFLVKFLTDVGDLVADPCGGWFRTALAAERLKRRWISTEKFAEYCLGGGLGFRNQPGFALAGRPAGSNW